MTDTCQDKLSGSAKAANVLMIGTGEYTTGFIGTKGSESDKGAGVVALTMMDMRSRHKVGRLAMCGVNGTKFPAIRSHMNQCLAEPYGLDTSCETYPDDATVDPEAYKTAIASFQPGDVAIIFTPDDTHYDIAMECISHGMHVMVTKPIVQTLEQHQKLAEAASAHNVLVAMEVHKRLDPFYADARDRAQVLGHFNYLYAYMSQPKFQLDTFRAWAGKSSDISYYLNSHHVDWSEWTLHGRARPIRVTAAASRGIASRILAPTTTEDSITLTVHWESLLNKDDDEASPSHVGIAVYTSSWVAPKSDVHSQQRFHYVAERGEINVDQAHRGCTVATDGAGFASVNPLFMKYAPSNGQFVGQSSYGVKSLENFVDACRAVNAKLVESPHHFDDGSLATIHTTYQGTAILEAGRRSLDANGRPIDLAYATGTSLVPIDLVPHAFGAPTGAAAAAAAADSQHK